MNIKDLLPQQIEALAAQDCQDVAITLRQELINLRVAGLSLLQYAEEELQSATEADLSWYKAEEQKRTTFDPTIMKGLVSEAPIQRRSIADSDAKAYIKECNATEKQELQDYLTEHQELLYMRYPLYISNWFVRWYAFWYSETSVHKSRLDWDIFFSLLNPKPPAHFCIKFNTIINKVNILERRDIRPKYFRAVWNNEDMRDKILHGEFVTFNQHICTFDELRSYIRNRQQESVLPKPKKQKKEASLLALENGVYSDEELEPDTHYNDDRAPSEVRDVFWLYAYRKTGTYPVDTERSGKWLVFVYVQNLDATWAKIKNATEQGLLGSRAKTATVRPNPLAYHENAKVICVFTYDWQDTADVMRVKDELRRLGITRGSYKTDDDIGQKYRIFEDTGYAKYSFGPPNQYEIAKIAAALKKARENGDDIEFVAKA